MYGSRGCLFMMMRRSVHGGVWDRPGLEAYKRKAYARLRSSTGLMKAAHNQNLGAILDMIRSVGTYPGRTGVGRVRVALVAALRMLGLKKSHADAQLGG